MKTRPKLSSKTLHNCQHRYARDVYGKVLNIHAQTIYSAPQKILVGTYTTKSGQVKNRYRVNPESKPLKIILH